jgi:predicted permease
VGATPALFALASEVPPNWAFFRIVGRLRPGTAAGELEGLLGGVHGALRARQPDRQSFLILDGKSARAQERLEVVPGNRGDSRLRGPASQALLVLAGMFLLVVVVLAANLANLLAVRALRDRGAAAIRLALGGTRWRIASGWLAESALLGVAGAALGTALAWWLAEGLLASPWLPAWMHGLTFAVDLRVLAIASALALLTALLTGGVAALEQSRAPQLRLREDSRATTSSPAGARWRDTLIGVQVALSVVLLVATGLFVRSAGHLLAIDTGLPLDRVLTLRVDLPPEPPERTVASLERLREELATLPGAVDASFSAHPVLGGISAYVMAQVEGYVPAPGEVMMLNTVAVGPRFLETLGLRVHGPREASTGDGLLGAGRVVVNRELARRYLEGRDPLGRRVAFGMSRGSWDEPREGDLTIAGVVDDRMMSDVREKATPRLYVPFTGPQAAATLYVRAAGDRTTLPVAMERVVRRLAPRVAAGPVATLEQQRDRSLARELLVRDLALGFGAGAAVLAGLGLFGVLSYAVRSRRRELGLRQALGARPMHLVRGVLVDGLRPVSGGLVVGLLIAAFAGRYAESQLFGVSTRDPVVYAAAALAMVLVGLAAALPAARRALRVDPALALRAE